MLVAAMLGGDTDQSLHPPSLEPLPLALTTIDGSHGTSMPSMLAPPATLVATLRDTARFCDRLYEMCSAQSSPWKNAPCLRGRLRRPLGNNRGVRRGLWAVKIHEATTVPTSGP